MKKGETKQAGKKGKSRRSFILTLALIALVGYFLISIVSLQVEIQDKKQELAEVQTQYEEVSAENQELKDIAEEEDEASYMERIARDVLGYVLPGESVYYDTSAGN